MKPKKGLKSRTNSLHATAAVAALVMALGAKWMPGLITVETSLEIAGGLLLAFSAIGVWLKADDRRKQALPLIVGADPGVTIHGSERAHPRCEDNRDGHRCTRPEGHVGAHSKPPIGGGK
jgi:small neutral amino acid transporter SnatA (MarC family)